MIKTLQVVQSVYMTIANKIIIIHNYFYLFCLCNFKVVTDSYEQMKSVDTSQHEVQYSDNFELYRNNHCLSIISSQIIKIIKWYRESQNDQINNRNRSEKLSEVNVLSYKHPPSSWFHSIKLFSIDTLRTQMEN